MQQASHAVMQDVNSAFSPDQSVFNFCSTATHGCSAAEVSFDCAVTLSRPVYESSFWTPKAEYASHNKERVATATATPQPPKAVFTPRPMPRGAVRRCATKRPCSMIQVQSCALGQIYFMNW